MRKYYYIKETDFIINSMDLTNSIRKVFGNDIAEHIINSDYVEEIDPPTIMDILDHKHYATTLIYRYMELHPDCDSIAKARHMVNQIAKQYKKKPCSL